MHFSTVISTLLFASTAFAVRAGFDNTYDNAGGDMNTVSCSTGSNGLEGRFPTFGDLPTFPNIGGSDSIAGFGSAECGSCWQLTFPDTGVSINVTAMDHAADGFNLSQEALDTLTNGNAVQDGAVQVDAVEVDKSGCGL
ncbi:eliciting plant response-like protein [Fomitiporia mediterranea MF3/22]|uniref:eliciting plant response-like protein n=1 Tax=Fomitiporia mediterranea (strain MF3/22) TaxID=694068 RepID=UPI000440871C|nr:eliciting plant response-like protein [Fomitiporia mediterranea MF3/22]EJC99991.1 eliciting plant response-like protein [Fomitiporia mediterranea MF3/22]